jgi:hypothetical protein
VSTVVQDTRDSLLAMYEDMRADRDEWRTRYNASESERERLRELMNSSGTIIIDPDPVETKRG